MARNMTPEQRDGLRKFQEHHGDDWQHEMLNCHMGRPLDSFTVDIQHLIRQIRNSVTADPNKLPDLRLPLRA